MTDERMDARLRVAGERWREANTSPAEVVLASSEVEDIVTTPTARGRHRTAWAAGLSSIAAAAVAVLVAVNLHGSGKRNTPATDSFDASIQGRWALRSVVPPNGKQLNAVAPASVQFTATSISGSDGCNALSGDVTFGPHSFDVGQGLATTAMGCIDRPAGFDQEVQLIHDVLNGTVQYAITADGLMLTGSTGAKLVYVRNDPIITTDPRALIGTWQLDTVGGAGPNGVASSAIPGTGRAGGLPTLQFSAGGVFMVDDGCNSGGGTATIKNGTISNMNGSSTLVLCTDAIMTQANQIDAVLTGDLLWTIKDGRLVLTKPNGGFLVYVAVASPSGRQKVATDTPTTPSASTSR